MRIFSFERGQSPDVDEIMSQGPTIDELAREYADTNIHGGAPIRWTDLYEGYMAGARDTQKRLVSDAIKGITLEAIGNASSQELWSLLTIVNTELSNRGEVDFNVPELLHAASDAELENELKERGYCVNEDPNFVEQ